MYFPVFQFNDFPSICISQIISNIQPNLSPNISVVLFIIIIFSILIGICFMLGWGGIIISVQRHGPNWGAFHEAQNYRLGRRDWGLKNPPLTAITSVTNLAYRPRHLIIMHNPVLQIPEWIFIRCYPLSIGEYRVWDLRYGSNTLGCWVPASIYHKYIINNTIHLIVWVPLI